MKEKSISNNYCVYMHINKTNGRMYIGQTCDVKERWRGNGKNYFNSIKFFRAIKKYGWNNFIHKIIKSNLSKEEADTLEKDLIEKFNTIKMGYNLKEGGARGILSAESLKKMGDSLRQGYKEHPERKEKIRRKALNRKCSEEAKRKMSLNGARTILVTIDGETGSIRYWAKKINLTHIPLIWQKRKHGYDAMVKYIKDRVQKISA